MMNPKYSISIFCILLFIACGKELKKKTIFPDFIAKEDVYLPLPKIVKHPNNNQTNSVKKKLGKLLFYDPILSGNKDVSCATCHHPSFGYAEPLDLSIGVNGVGLGYKRKFRKNNDIPFVKRNAHTVLNTAYNGIGLKGDYNPENAAMFWDVRKNSLETQALAPIESFEEMRGNKIDEKDILDSIINRLQNIPEYVQLFEKAFQNEKAINEDNLAKAIAAFERTLITPNSRFDQFLRGDSTAISKGEKDGFKLFKKAKCNLCHNGPMFSDYKLHVLSVEDNMKLLNSDDGFEKTYAFRTPTLRNLRFTAPYMHNGKLKDLLSVLEFYEDISSGPSKNSNIPTKKIDSLARKIDLKVIDMSMIISFLNTLNSEDFDKEIPEKVPSRLPVGGNIY